MKKKWVDERRRSVQGLKLAPLISIRLTPEHSAPQSSATLAKDKLSSVQSFQTGSGGTPFLLCRFEGQVDVLKQILALEKKVFAKRASWTGKYQQDIAVKVTAG